MSNNLIDREITQGIIPIGTPKAYKYDAALVEAAKATVQQGMTGIAEKTEEEKSELDGYTEEKKTEVSTVGQSYVDSASQKVAEANTILSAIRNEYGYPFTAATAAAMTDTSKIYVYVGNETGYVNGNWYYNNGTAWVSGGVYNSTAFETDKTLTVSGSAADAKMTGDIKTDLGVVAIGYDDFAASIWEKGALGNVGIDDSYRSNVRARFKKFHIFELGYTITALDNYTKILVYTDDGGTITGSGWVTQITVQPNKKTRTMVDCDWGGSASEDLPLPSVLSHVRIVPLLPSVVELNESVVELNDINAVVEQNNIVSNNLCRGLVEEGYINPSTGGVVLNSAWLTSDYMPVKSGTTYYEFGVGSNVRFAFYDEHKVFVDIRSNPDIAEDSKLKNPFTVPNGIAYMRVSNTVGESDYTYVSTDPIPEQYTTLQNAFALKNKYIGNALAFVDGHYEAKMFMRGSVGLDGTASSYLKERTVFSKSLMYAPCRLYISSPYNAFSILYYNDDKTLSGNTGLVKKATIEKGQLYRLWIRSSVSDTIENIVNLVTVKSVTLDKDDIVPSYYFDNDYLPNKVNDILEKSPLNGLSFVFITDFHVTDNQCHSPALIKYLKEHTNSVPFVIFGGDVLVSTVAEGVDVMGDAKRWQQLMCVMDKNNVYQVQGNHDYLGFHYVDGERVPFTSPAWKTIKQLVMGNLSNKNVTFYNGSKIVYYFDVEPNTRIIVLNDYDSPYNEAEFGGGNAFSKEQLAWVCNVALADDTKHVIFISHQTYDENMEGENQDRFIGIQNLFKAVKNKTIYSYGALEKDFRNTNLTFVAHFVGHKHADASHVDDNVLTICTTCDALYDTVNRTAGTITEQAFDVVSVDFANNRINTSRIGYGLNREFSF